jgi:hypothetical protein
VDLLEDLSRIRVLVGLFQRQANDLFKIGMEKMKECGLFGDGPLNDKLLQEANDILFVSKEYRDKVIQLLKESQSIVEAL